MRIFLIIAIVLGLAAVGIDWVSVALPGDTRAAQLSAIDRFGGSVLAAVAGL